jgi:hypothetical protein
VHPGSYGLTPAAGQPPAGPARSGTWPVRSGLVPPLAEGFIARTETVPGLEAALVPGAAVALGELPVGPADHGPAPAQRRNRPGRRAGLRAGGAGPGRRGDRQLRHPLPRVPGLLRPAAGAASRGRHRPTARGGGHLDTVWSLQRGFAVPAESQPRPRPPHPDQACSATPGTISGDYALELRTTSCLAPAHLSQASGRSRSSSRSSLPFSRRSTNDTVPPPPVSAFNVISR